MGLLHMFRARWYQTTHLVPFWGFLALLGCSALMATDSTLRFNDVPVGFDGAGIEWQLKLAVLTIAASLLCCISLAGLDEQVGTAKMCLVGPGSRTQWVLAGLMRFVAVLVCYTVMFYGAVWLALCLSGYLPTVTLEGVGRLFGFLGAMMVVALAYGSLLSLVMVICRRTAAGVLALFFLVSGIAERACADFLVLIGSGALASWVDSHFLFAQLFALSQGEIPEAGGLVLAAFVTVASTGIAVVAFGRRNLG